MLKFEMAIRHPVEEKKLVTAVAIKKENQVAG